MFPLSLRRLSLLQDQTSSDKAAKTTLINPKDINACNIPETYSEPCQTSRM